MVAFFVGSLWGAFVAVIAMVLVIRSRMIQVVSSPLGYYEDGDSCASFLRCPAVSPPR